MDKVQLYVLGLSYSQEQSGAYALILSEVNGDKRLPIIVGSTEAQSIAIFMEKLNPPRPLTHDLFKTVVDAFDVEAKEVFINGLSEGIFYSEIIFEKDRNRIRIDSRTSDAIALALRFECPIYTTREILEKAGIFMEIEQEKIEEPFPPTPTTPTDSNPFLDYTVEQLQIMLEEAVNDENYERASTIRDEIRKRTQNQ